MATKGLVSVIIPCYNSENLVTETLMSVFSQNYPSLEVICVDDGSTDSTLIKLNALKAPTHISYKVISSENRGASAARNLALNHATGEFIQFLDSDDLISNNKISKQISQFSDGVDIIVSDYLKMDYHLKTINSKSDFSEIEKDPLLYAITHVISSLNPLYRRSIIDQFGTYDESLPCSQDWEFNLRLILAKSKVKFVDGQYSTIRQVENSVSSNYSKIVIQCSLILIKLKPTLLESELNSNHKLAISKWFYEAAIYSKNSDEMMYVKEAIFWSPNLSFLSKSKQIIKWFIGIKGLVKFDRSRILKKD